MIELLGFYFTFSTVSLGGKLGESAVHKVDHSQPDKMETFDLLYGSYHNNFKSYFWLPKLIMELRFIMRTEKKPQGEGFKNLLGNLILIFKILTLVQLVT